MPTLLRVGTLLGLCLTVEPLSTCPTWTIEGEQADTLFGAFVATAGDVNGDGFDDVLVGAPNFGNGQSNEGRALLFLGSAGSLATSPAWTAESEQAFARLGPVTSAGDVNGDGFDDVLVGAPDFTDDLYQEGGAFVYLGSATGLATAPAWSAEGDQVFAYFGSAVACAGDVNGDGFDDVLVGAYNFENGEVNEGGAFLYLGSATGLATSPAWTADGGQTSSLFGAQVASAGDVNGDGYDDVLVGAQQLTDGDSAEGGAFLYLGSALGLASAPAWTVEGGQPDAALGRSLASAGDVNGDGFDDVLVGAPSASFGEAYEGRVSVYLGSPSGPSTSPDWTAEGDSPSALFGVSVASAGDVNGDGYDDVILGADRFERVLVYTGSAAGLSSTPSWTETDVGDVVASAGDVNGDGYDDVLVGEPAFTHGQTREGRALAYLGSLAGIQPPPSVPTPFLGDGLNADAILPVTTVIGSRWSAPLLIGHPHGTQGLLVLDIRSATLNGPNFPSPKGGRLTERLIAGQFFGRSIGSHDDLAGDIPDQWIPDSPALVGIPWAAQYIVSGGGFADYSLALQGVIESCP